MKINFIRHFKTKGNLERRYIGTTDEEILEFQPKIIYPNSELVFSSDLKRCVKTAELIYPNTKIIQLKELRETNFGLFEYKNYEELKDNDDYKKWLENGGESGFSEGEKLRSFIDRTIDGFKKAIELAKLNGKEEIAFVVHGGSIMAVLSHYIGGDFYDFQVENGCGYTTSFEDSKLQILGEIK